MKVLWIVLAVLAVLIGVSLLAYMGAANTANGYENRIAASYQQSENVLGQLAPKLKEALGVTKLEVSSVRDVVVGANSSRYGPDGSKAVAQFIKEQNPNLNPAGFDQIRNMIEASRNDFMTAQERTIDENRAYKTALGHMPGSFFMRLAGYPTEEFRSKHYDDPVMSGHAAGAFETRRDDGVNLNSF